MKAFYVILSCILALVQFSCSQPSSEIGLAALKNGRSKAETSHATDVGSNADRLPFIHPGETAVIFDVEGTGVINHIWLTFNRASPNWYEKKGSANPAELVVRMYWDNASEPSVEAPLGDFFGAGFGLRNEIRSDPVSVETGDGYNCFWQMPFNKAAKITITNDGNKAARGFYYQIDYTEYKKLPKNTAYFCAQYRQEYPEKMGSDYLIADIEGQGHYVGTVMSVRSRSPLWFGEGDAKFYVDGELQPSSWGTGTEDYFLCAWGLSECLFDYYGCTYLSAHPGDVGVKFSLYRWHIKDPVMFPKSLRFEMEHNGWISDDETIDGKEDGHVEREDDIATVAFWYQKGQPKRFYTLPPYEERVLPNLESVIEGKEMIASVRHSKGEVKLQEGYDWTGDGQILFTPSTGNAWLEADFIIEEEEYSGLIIKMTHANNYGNYKVFVDGKAIPRKPGSIDFNVHDPDKEVKILDLYAEDLEVRDYYLGSASLKKGKHTIRFEQLGKDPYSTGNALGFDSFSLFERWGKKRFSLGPNSATSTEWPNK